MLLQGGVSCKPGLPMLQERKSKLRPAKGDQLPFLQNSPGVVEADIWLLLELSSLQKALGTAEAEKDQALTQLQQDFDALQKQYNDLQVPPAHRSSCTSLCYCRLLLRKDKMRPLLVNHPPACQGKELV